MPWKKSRKKVAKRLGSEIKNAYLYISRKGNGSRLKIRDMAIGRRNSGKFQQDAVIGKFARDARGTQNSTAVEAALEQGIAKAEYLANQKDQPRVSFKFLATGK
jgi:hypothetical protein